MFRPLPAALLALALITTACVSDAHGQGWPGERNAVPTQSARNFFNLATSLMGDSFGRLRVSEPVIEGDAKFTSDLLPLRFGTIATGAGASVAHASPRPQARLRVTNASERALIRSFEYHRYRAAQSQLIRMTAQLGAPTAGIEARMGYFSDSDGVFLAQTTALCSLKWEALQ